MTTISTGTTSTTAYVATSDTTGTLVIKTGSGSVTALTIDASQNTVFVGTISTLTAAAKTSTTQGATTAFVDALRSLLTSATTGTAVIGDRGCLISLAAGLTVPASVFAANDTFTVYNNTAGNLTITQGASLTLRLVGSATTGNRILAQRGLATIVFISAIEAVISGGGIT